MNRHSPAHCIAFCHECRATCLALLPHCLTKGGIHAAPWHVATLLDCAEICGTCASFQARRSEGIRDICRLCADLCDRCADDCARFRADPEMLNCVQACRRCADACRLISEAPRVGRKGKIA